MRTSRAVTLAAVLAVASAGAAVVAVRTATAPDTDPQVAPAASASTSPTGTAEPAPAQTLRIDAILSRGPAPAAPRVNRALAADLVARVIGRRLSVTVTSAAGDPLVDRNSHAPVVPASTVKLLTATAALRTLGAETRIATRVVTVAELRAGVLHGDLAVVGGGDATFGMPHGYPRAARLGTLVAQVRAAGIQRVTGRLLTDDSLFSGPTTGPGWRPSYLTGGHVAPVAALSVDGARVRTGRSERFRDPAMAAVGRFRAALRAAGVVVVGATVRARAPQGARDVAVVWSPPVRSLVERMVERSDNDIAESLGRLTALRRGEPPTFAGAAAAVLQSAGELGAVTARARLYDASGLSPLNRLTTRSLVDVLRAVVDPRHPELRPVLRGLPVAGFAGTLSSRYRRGQTSLYAGRVRAKTGSLNNVATLSGIVVTRSGHSLLFAMAADGVPTTDTDAAAAALDVIAARLASCGCSA